MTKKLSTFSTYIVFLLIELLKTRMEELEKILNEDGNREMVAIQVADTNHNIFNVYGWVDATELEENKEGKIELVQGDNTEMLEQLQKQEQEGER